MPKPFALVLAGLVAVTSLAGCQEDETPEPAESAVTVPAAFPVVLVPPEGRVVSRSGGEDALQLVFRSPQAPDLVADYYRQRLLAAPWEIVSDTRSGDATVIYAEASGRPLWVRVTAGDAGVGSRIEMTGAVVGGDTAGSAAGTDSAPADAVSPADSGAITGRPQRPER